MINQVRGRLSLDADHATVGMVEIGIESCDSTILDSRYCSAVRCAEGAIPANGIIIG